MTSLFRKIGKFPGISGAVLVVVAFFFGGCAEKLAGGIDEQTNTVASQVESPSTDITVPSPESSQSTPVPTTADLSDSPNNTDASDLSASSSSVQGCSSSTDYFVGRLLTRESRLFDVVVKTSEGDFRSQTDSSGLFILTDLPRGTFPMYVSTIGQDSYDIAYFLQNENGSRDLRGPLPSSATTTVHFSELAAPVVQTFVDPTPDASSSSSINAEVSSSSRAEEGTGDGSAAAVGAVAGASVDKGFVQQYYLSRNGLILVVAESMPEASDYGVLARWDVSDIPANGTAVKSDIPYSWDQESFTLEVLFRLRSTDLPGGTAVNIFSMRDADRDVYRLFIGKDVCGSEETILGFFAENEGSAASSCGTVMTAAGVSTDEPVALTVVWTDREIDLYRNGFLVAKKIPGNKRYSHSETEIVFGDDEGLVQLDEVRLGDKAIQPADVLYRYYLAGGER